MLLQNTQADCGPAALHNALEVLGHRRSMDELRDLCRMTAGGVDEKKLMKAVANLKEALGLQPWVIRETRRMCAAGLTHLAMSRGRPIICAVDLDDHWVTLAAMAGERFLIIDSAEAGLMQSLDGEAWFNRWNSGGRYPYWGLVL